MDFTTFTTNFNRIQRDHGVTLTWRQRATGSGTGTSDPYFTGSGTLSYGYGDVVINYSTGSFSAIVEPLSTQDRSLLQGVYKESDFKIYIASDVDIRLWDRIYFPSGLFGTGSDSQEYLLAPPLPIVVNGKTVYNLIYVKCLIPAEEESMR